MHIEKKNKRLVVVDGTEVIYTPPEFIRKKIRSRSDMNVIVEKLNEGVARIDVIWCFERMIGDRS